MALRVEKFARADAPPRAIGTAILSDGRSYPVFTFSAAAHCQEAQLRQWPVKILIKADDHGTYLEDVWPDA